MEIIIYISTVLFAILIFPVHIYNYIYVDSGEGYASVNVCLFRYLRVLNANTVKNKIGAIDINGKEGKANFEGSYFKVLKFSYNRIYLDKLVQLADYGLKEESNAYLALGQNGLTQAVYALCKKSPNVKLKNYTIFNEEHGAVRYYLKIVTVVNLITLTQIFLCFLREKVNEKRN